MKKTKRFIALLLTAALLAMTPLTALAASGYVPTKGEYYYKEGKKWVKSEVFSYKYKGDGKITEAVYKYDDGTSKTKYKWKGNKIAKITYSDGYTSYKYKKNKLVEVTYDYGGKSTNKISWKKNTGTYKTDYTTTTIKVNGKGQVTSVKYVYSDKTSSSESYKYYGNGNRKSYTYKGSGGYTYKAEYNSKGYVKKITQKGDGYSYSVSYSYKTKKGKLVSRIRKWKNSDGDSGESKTVYKKWKRVSNVRNCDGFWQELPLG